MRMAPATLLLRAIKRKEGDRRHFFSAFSAVSARDGVLALSARDIRIPLPTISPPLSSILSVATYSEALCSVLN